MIIVERVRRYFRRRKMIRNGEDPDRIITRQQRRAMQRKLAKRLNRTH